ncbi:MAG TPA: tetratricopeptide repeat protein [Candidatus Hydrogenedentes bacterium]|nr:tetratricopeptide repeat protein [Candidatus Hydrogenedentota bacterium]
MPKTNLLISIGLMIAMIGATAAAEQNLCISYYLTGTASDSSGNFKEAAILLQKAADEACKNVRKAEALDGLGQAAIALGEFDKADQCLRDAYKLKKKSLGKRHREMATTINNLADLNFLQKKTEAECLYRRALEINRHDETNLEVCRSLNGIALIKSAADAPVEAENLLLRAVQLHEKAQRRHHPYLATNLTNLGILYTAQNRYPEAEQALERARVIQDQALGECHPDVAVRLSAMAALCAATNRTAEAICLAERAEEIRAKQRAVGNLY